VLSLFFGDVFRAINPWRAIGRASGWVARRVAGDGLPEPLAYPARLGRWPAVAGIFGFVWLELVYATPGDPSTLAILALVYAAIQLVGMSLYGVEAWERDGDGFGVYFGLFGKLSPLHWHERRLSLRPPLSGLTDVRLVPGMVALLALAIGSTSFDGFRGNTNWTSLALHVQGWLEDLGLNATHGLEVAYTLGLLLFWGIAAGLYWLGVYGMRSVDRSSAPSELALRFVHSLVPIALAYVIAHYFSFLAYQAQAMGFLISDPLGKGWDLFGTADATIDYTVVSATGIWYVQVVSLVVGHVSGLMLAHDRALVSFRDARKAARSQYWMLAVMVAFTSMGLWLLSQAS
jgi:hypothetical protein